MFGRDAGETIHVDHGTGATPKLDEIVVGEAGLFTCGADMAGALTGPHHIAGPERGMVEGVDLQAGLVGAGDKRIAGAEAGAEHAELFVPLLLQPIETAANIDHGLAAGGQRSPNVGADGVVGTFQFGGAANVVEGLAESQRRNSKTIEQGAERVVAEGIRIPLRHDDDGLLWLALLLFGRSGIPARVDLIVFWIGSAQRGGEAEKLRLGQLAFGGQLFQLGIVAECFRAHVGGEQLRMTFFQAKIRGSFVAVELLGRSDDAFIDGEHGGVGLRRITAGDGIANGQTRDGRQIARGDPIFQPVKSPFQRADNAIGIARRQLRFPGVHPSCVQRFQHAASMLAARGLFRSDAGHAGGDGAEDFVGDGAGPAGVIVGSDAVTVLVAEDDDLVAGGGVGDVGDVDDG